MIADQLKPGTRIRVTQTIRRRDQDWQSSVTGEVLTCEEEKTGSWYAHAPGGKLMLLRIHIRKDDGELTTVCLDQRSSVEVLMADEKA